MGKSIGSSAGILALVAVLVHTFGGSGSEHPSTPASSPQTMPGLSASGGSGDHPKGFGLERQGPWRATQQYFHSDPKLRGTDYGPCLSKPTDACLQTLVEDLYAFPEKFDFHNLHGVIATVPDPLHTRMAMETDRFLDAIQQAAFDSGYELASQWLPWTVKAAAEKTAGGDGDSQSFDWEKLPGLLVFRPHFRRESTNVDALLLVFVVGETPTSGINGFQFELARRTIFTLDTQQPHDLHIAGPNFSGSFLPLTRLLEESPGRDRVHLRSASVSNFEYAGAMLTELQRKGFVVDRTMDGHPSVTFHASTLPGQLFHTHFLELADRLGVKPEEVAEIMEDETGFSFVGTHYSDRMGAHPIIYRYPRDIAQLRNHYNDSAFASTDANSSAPPPVDFSLKDTQSGEDEFPTFSTSHTPSSQNAVLQQIADDLKHSSVHLVSLSASNVFDTLFLANVLARNCPNTRVVVAGADLLFVQEAAEGALSGVMAISPFPLFPEGTEIMQRGMPPSAPRDVTTFATSDQIEEFNAVLALLEPFATDGSLRYRQKYGAAPANAADDFSSAWLLVLGSRGWMPVDLLSQPNPPLKVKDTAAAWFDPAEAAPKEQQALTGLMTAGPGWIALCVMLSGFSLAFCFRLFYLKAQPNKHVWSVLCLSDLETKKRRHAMGEIVHGRYFCMISCFAILAAVNGLLLCPMMVMLFKHAGPAGWRDGAALLATFVAFFGCTLVSIWLAVAVVPIRVCHADPFGECSLQTPRSWPSIGLRSLVILVALGAVCVWWTCCDNGVAGYMLCFRTLTLATPVSPILPLLLACLGLFALAYFHLRRFTWGDRRQPYLDTSVFDKALCDEFKQIKERLQCAILGRFGAGGRPGLIMAGTVAAIFIVSLWILLPSGSLSSFEPTRFSNVLRLLLVLLAFFTLVTLLRFGWCWSLFRAFLANLNSVVLGRYFARVPEFGGGSGPVWIREVKLMSLATAINSCIALHNLELVQKTPGAYTPKYISELQNFLCPTGSRFDFIRAYEQFRITASDIATTLGREILHKYWVSNELPFVGTSASENNGEPAAKKLDSAKDDKLTAAASSNRIELKTLTAAVGQMQSFFLESHTSPAQMVQPAKEEAPSAAANECASKYVALHYSAYIGYVLHQLQNLLLCSVISFVVIVLALNSFSFQSPQAIFYLVSIGLLVGGAIVLVAFAQMERDPILSRLSGTPEGELGKDFYIRALTYGALPVLTVLSTQFPAIARYVTAWAQPVSAALR